MSAPFDTLLLDLSTWDLVLDAGGNIARATYPYAIAQDVSCSIRTFLGECWYNTLLGVDYRGRILGKAPPLNLFQELMVDAALQVPGVTSGLCTIQSFISRGVLGQVQFTDVNGKTQTVNLANAQTIPLGI